MENDFTAYADLNGIGAQSISMDSTTVYIFGFLYLALIIFLLYCGWKLFTKANKPGWASLIPIYNAIVILQIAGKPIWWFLLMLIPLVNIIVAIVITHNISIRFGKGMGFTLGLLFLPFIFLPILALGSAKYTPVNQSQEAMNNQQA